MNIEDLSTRELSILKARIEGMIEERDRRLNSYEYVANDVKLNKDVLIAYLTQYFEEYQTLSRTAFHTILAASKDMISNSATTRYSCPDCGQFTLKVTDDFPENKFTKYIKCTNPDCDFIHDDADNSEIDAWKRFHRWLMVQGYLPMDTPFIEDI